MWGACACPFVGVCKGKGKEISRRKAKRTPKQQQQQQQQQQRQQLNQIVDSKASERKTSRGRGETTTRGKGKSKQGQIRKKRTTSIWLRLACFRACYFLCFSFSFSRLCLNGGLYLPGRSHLLHLLLFVSFNSHGKGGGLFFYALSHLNPTTCTTLACFLTVFCFRGRRRSLLLLDDAFPPHTICVHTRTHVPGWMRRDGPTDETCKGSHIHIYTHIHTYTYM